MQEIQKLSGSSFDFAPFDWAQDKQDGEPACSELVEPRLSAPLRPGMNLGGTGDERLFSFDPMREQLFDWNR